MKKQFKSTFRILLSLLLAVLVPVSVPFSAAAEGETQAAVTYIERVWEFGTGVVTATEKPLEEPAKAFPGALDGGDVTATGKYGGAAIGAGAEAFSSAGGECEGTVEILDGTVQLWTDISDWDETDRPAMIGHGYDGDTQGTLVLGDTMMVCLAEESAVLTAERDSTCRKGYSASLTIKPCDHKNAAYSEITETTHDVACNTCKYTATEAHTFAFGACRCGKTGCTVVFFDGESVYDTQSIAGSGQTTTRPADPEKTNLVFDDWYPDGAADYTTPYDFTQPVTEDTFLQAHWQVRVTVAAIDATEQQVAQDGKVWLDGLDDGFYASVNALVEPGSLVSFTAQANEGYEFRGWAVGNLDNLIPAPSFGTNFSSNATVMAVFEKHEHQYGRPDWTWADDYSSARAAFTCSCGDIQTVDAAITKEEITPADCTTEQVAIFTATVDFGGETYTDKTGEVAVPGSACHMFGIRITPATCTHDGITTFKCVRCGYTYTENPVPAMGHRDDDHNGVCDNCGEPMPDSGSTPSQSGKCKWCGKTYRGF